MPPKRAPAKRSAAKRGVTRLPLPKNSAAAKAAAAPPVFRFGTGAPAPAPVFHFGRSVPGAPPVSVPNAGTAKRSVAAKRAAAKRPLGWLAKDRYEFATGKPVSRKAMAARAKAMGVRRIRDKFGRFIQQHEEEWMVRRRGDLPDAGGGAQMRHSRLQWADEADRALTLEDLEEANPLVFHAAVTPGTVTYPNDPQPAPGSPPRPRTHRPGAKRAAAKRGVTRLPVPKNSAAAAEERRRAAEATRRRMDWHTRPGEG